MSTAFQQLAVEAEKAVKDLGIPPCPAILGRIMRESAAVDPDFRKIGEWLSADVSLAAAMLKTVNSPFYGLQRKAETVHQALMFLGLRTVSLIVTRLMLRQVFSNGTTRASWSSGTDRRGSRPRAVGLPSICARWIATSPTPSRCSATAGCR